MYLSCPVCEERYQLEGVALGPRGKRVRCGACGHVWRAFDPDKATPAAAEPLPEETSGMTPAPFPQDALPEEDNNRQNGAGEDIPDVVKPRPLRPKKEEKEIRPKLAQLSMLQTAAVTFVVLLAMTLTLLLSFYQPLARALPGLVPLYKVLGVDVAPKGAGFHLSALKAEKRKEAVAGENKEEEQSALHVSARLRNLSPMAQPTPALDVLARDHDGAVVKLWHLPAPADRQLASGEEVPLRAAFRDAPAEAVRLEIKVSE